MRSTYCGIFFISVAALLLEISLTRIFSVSRWYHFAFMVVSIALLGFAASGSFLNLFPRIQKNQYSPFVSSLLFSVSVVISFYVSDKIEMDPYKVMVEPHLLGSIAVYYLLLSLPFLFAGFAISIPLARKPKNAGILYGFNLAGSAAGCLLIFSFSVFGSKIILFSSLLGVLSSLFFAFQWKHRLISFCVLVILLILPANIYDITMSPYKALPLALNYPEAEIVHTEWNTISRVDIVKSPVRHAPGLSLKFFEGLPSQLGLTVDGDNISSLSEPGLFIEYLPTAAAYLHERKEVLIINPQGLDVATAQYFGATTTVTEGNPLTIESAQKFSRVYENIEIQFQDGRSFLASTNKKYDVIQISLSESLFASSVGLYGFNESYLFTKEAFEQYYSHLTDDGVLVITRWLLVPPRELPRLVSLIIETEIPQDHIIIFRTYSTTTILLKKTPFGNEIADIEAFLKDRGFDLVWVSGIQEDQVNIYNQFDEPYFYQLVTSQFFNNVQVEKEYLFAIEPPTDDKPFFFNFFQWRKFQQIYQSLRGKWQPLFEGGFMAVLILIQALLVSLLLIVAPLKRLSLERFTLWYFMLIGLAFMFVEISLIQQFILFLGQPTYSVTLVLFSVLLFSGMGSYSSQKIFWKKGFFFLGLFLFFLIVGLPFLIHSWLGLDLHLKIVIGVAVLAPLSFFMGIPFPTGIAVVGEKQVPYAWCVNGCSSVCGSVLSVMVALSFGFRVVLGLGLLCYGMAFLVRTIILK
ncbi:MAG: hypothetical protein HXS48_26235 [Theionarchaea archaeon]|nr:hypothetical protein [Theionarchaea archaeon]